MRVDIARDDDTYWTGWGKPSVALPLIEAELQAQERRLRELLAEPNFEEKNS